MSWRWLLDRLELEDHASVSRDRCCIFLPRGTRGIRVLDLIGVPTPRPSTMSSVPARDDPPSPTSYPWAYERCGGRSHGNVLRLGSDPDDRHPAWLDVRAKLAAPRAGNRPRRHRFTIDRRFACGHAPPERLSLLLLTVPAAVRAQGAAVLSPLDATRAGFAEVADWIVRAAESVPEAQYGYKPTDAVRTFGQLVGQY
jgi:hypothetical protein